MWCFFFACFGHVKQPRESPLPPCLRQKMKLNEYLSDKEQDGRRAKGRSGEDGHIASCLCTKRFGIPCVLAPKTSQNIPKHIQLCQGLGGILQLDAWTVRGCDFLGPSKRLKLANCVLPCFTMFYLFHLLQMCTVLLLLQHGNNSMG